MNNNNNKYVEVKDIDIPMSDDIKYHEFELMEVTLTEIKTFTKVADSGYTFLWFYLYATNSDGEKMEPMRVIVKNMDTGDSFFGNIKPLLTQLGVPTNTKTVVASIRNACPKQIKLVPLNNYVDNALTQKFEVDASRNFVNPRFDFERALIDAEDIQERLKANNKKSKK